MKAEAKRLFCLFLCVVMLVGLFPTASLAEEEGAALSPAVEDRSKYRIRGTNTLGKAFANSLQADLDSKPEEANQISDVSVESDGIAVGYLASEAAELVVAFYADPGEEESPALRLLTTATAAVDPDGNGIVLPLPDDLPEYYIVGAFLLRSGTHEPLCEEYTSSLYTKRYQDFIHAPLADFEDSGDRLLVLEEGSELDGSDASFAVFAEDVLLVRETAAQNHLSDNGDGSFTFTAPDASVAALQVGDKLAYRGLDGSITVILVLSLSLDENGSLTLIHDEKAEASSFFNTIRIDAADDPEGDPTVDMSSASPYVEYLPDESVSAEVDQIIAQVDAGGDAPLYAGTSDAIVMDAPGDATEISLGHEFSFNFWDKDKTTLDNGTGFTGKASFTPSLILRYYFGDGIDYLSTELNMEIAANLCIKLVVGDDYSFGTLDIPVGIPGVTVQVEPILTLKAQISITLVAKWEFAFGTEYDSRRARGDQWHPIRKVSDQLPKTTMKYEGKLSIGFKINLGIAVLPLDNPLKPSESKNALVAEGHSFSVTVDFKAELFDFASFFKEKSDSELHECEACITGSITKTYALGYYINAFYGLIEEETDDDEAASITKPVADFYYSLDAQEGGYGRCPHWKFKVTFSVVDGIDYDQEKLSGSQLEETLAANLDAHKVPGCVLSIRDKKGTYIQTQELTTDENGIAAIFLPEGSYEVVGMTDTLYGKQAVEVEDSAREVYFRLDPAKTESGTSGSLTWVFYPDSGLLSISGQGEMEDFHAVEDDPYTIDSPWEQYRDRTTSILLRPGVKNVGKNAFSHFRKVTTLQIPGSCTRIGDGAFSNLRQLKRLTIPGTMEDIGQGAFQYCHALETLVFDGSLRAWRDLKSQHIHRFNDPLLNIEPIFNSSILDKGQCGENLVWSLSNTGVLTISGRGPMDSYTDSEIPWVDYRDEIEALALEGGITSISPGAFSKLTKITEVMIPDSVKSLGALAFEGCKNLTSVHLPDGLTEIPTGCFRSCKNLDAINLPYSIVSIRDNAFTGCSMGTKPKATVFYEGTDQEWERRVKPNVAVGNEPLLRVLTTYSSGSSLSGSCGDDLNYILTLSGILILEGSGDMTSHPWQEAASANAGDGYAVSKITAVRIPEGVTSICAYAFQNCTGLRSVRIPDSVETIGQSVFKNCKNLTSLTVPFLGESRDKSNTLGYLFTAPLSDSYQIPNGLTSVEITDATTISAYAFYDYYMRGLSGGNVHLTSIVLNDGITSIGGNAFKGQSLLESIRLPADLTSVGASPFDGCSKLKTIEFPDGLTVIPDSMFAGCTGLQAYDIPAQVTTVGASAFAGCTGLTSFTIPNTVETIGQSVFKNCKNLTSLTVPFLGESRDKSNTLGYLFTAPLSDSYQIPNGLTSVEITDATTISAYAFYDYYMRGLSGGNVHLTSIVLNDGITSIGGNAFKGQSLLESIRLPADLTSVGASPFDGCSKLKTIEFPDGLTVIPDSMFAGCTGLREYQIPPQITEIGRYAFQGCTGLTEFTISNTVQTIGQYVFDGCKNLTSLKVPFIGSNRDDSQRLSYLFKTDDGGVYYAPNVLTSVTVTDAKSISAYAFSGMRGMDPSNNVKIISIILNDEITSIGSYAFSQQSLLESFHLPASITTIGSSAFSGCSGLTEAFYPGTMEEWLSVSIESGNDILNQIRIHCSDGDLLNGEEVEPTEDPEVPGEGEETGEGEEAGEGEDGGSISSIEPVIEPVPTEEPAPTEDPAPTGEPAPTEDPAPIEDPTPGEEPGYIGLASFSGESAPVDETVYAASFAGLVPGEQYVLLITEEDVENLDLRFASILFIAQGAAGEDGTLRFSYIRLPSENAPVIRLYGRSDKDLGNADALTLLMHKGVTDPNAYSVHVSYEGTELKENEDYILSMAYQQGGVIAVTVKGIRAYSGSRTFLAKETCLEAAETPDGYAVIRTPHSWGAWGESSATCEESGERLRSCTGCGKTESEATEPIGHLWGDPVWTWSEDLTGAEASFSCAHDSSHVTTLEASITQDGEDEYGVYRTAVVSFQGQTYSDRQYLRLIHPGDLNRDGEVDSLDLLRLRQMLVGTETLSPAADLNGDSEVDILDLVRFLKYLAGEDVTLHDPRG